MRQQMAEAYESHTRTTLLAPFHGCVSCVTTVARTLCCRPIVRRSYSPAPSSEQTLLESRQQQQQLPTTVEATTSPPRPPVVVSDRAGLLPKPFNRGSSAPPRKAPLLTKGALSSSSKFFYGRYCRAPLKGSNIDAFISAFTPSLSLFILIS